MRLLKQSLGCFRRGLTAWDWNLELWKILEKPLIILEKCSSLKSSCKKAKENFWLRGIRYESSFRPAGRFQTEESSRYQ